MCGNDPPSQWVVITIDAHRASWTAAAMSSGLAPPPTLRTPVSRQGHRQSRRFAARWPTAAWAIEGVSRTGLSAGCCRATDH